MLRSKHGKGRWVWHRRLWKDLWEHRMGISSVGGVGEELNPEEGSPRGDRVRVEERLSLFWLL